MNWTEDNGWDSCKLETHCNATRTQHNRARSTDCCLSAWRRDKIRPEIAAVSYRVRLPDSVALGWHWLYTLVITMSIYVSACPHTRYSRTVSAAICCKTYYFIGHSGLSDICNGFPLQEDQLFSTVNHNQQHLLHYLLPPPPAASLSYDLRHRAHNRSLPDRAGHLVDSNFMSRIILKNM